MKFNAREIRLKRLLFAQSDNWKRQYWIRLRVYENGEYYYSIPRLLLLLILSLLTVFLLQFSATNSSLLIALIHYLLIYIFVFQLNSVLCGNDTHLIYYTTWGLNTLADNPLTSFWCRCRGTVKNWKLNFVLIALWITDVSCDCNLLLDSGWCIWEIKGKKNSCYLI